MTQQQFEDNLDEIMNWFEFRKVEKAMKVLKWKWAGTDFKTPSEPEIRQAVMKQFRQMYQDKRKFGAIGGFSYTIDYDNNFINLEFILTYWTTIG